MNILKKILGSILIITILLFILLYFYLKADTKIPYDRPDPIPVEVPTFSEIPVDFIHNFSNSDHLPIMGAGIIDVDGDGTPELWLGGGKNQDDALYKFLDNEMVDIGNAWNLKGKNKNHQSYGPAVCDFDNDGDQDLLVCREDDIYYYENQSDKFSVSKLNIPFDDKSAPISITAGDINNDGLIDLYVSTYLHTSLMEGQTIFLQEGYGSNSLLLLNKGNNEFENITLSAGLNYTHNTFTAVFIDIDQDLDLDLVVAHDTGEVRTYRNNGDITFTKMKNPMTDKFGYPMGIAAGDYNNDGLPDFFFSNVGSTMPKSLLKGDLDLSQHTFIPEWLLFENTGNFQFREVGNETNLAKYEFSWGAIFEDFNLDGLQDLVVAENYVDLPNFKLVKLPCRFLVNTPNHEFIAVEDKAGVSNPYYAISPLSADFNNDGYPDLVYSNIAGPARVWINNGGNNYFIKVQIAPQAQNIGAKVEVIQPDGKTLTDWLTIGEGLGSDQSNTLVFGLDDNPQVSSIKISYPDGRVQTIENPQINQTLVIDSYIPEKNENPDEILEKPKGPHYILLY